MNLINLLLLRKSCQLIYQNYLTNSIKYWLIKILKNTGEEKNNIPTFELSAEAVLSRSNSRCTAMQAQKVLKATKCNNKTLLLSQSVFGY